MGEPDLLESCRVSQKPFRLFQLIQVPSSQRTQNESCCLFGAMISAHMRMRGGRRQLEVHA